MGWFSNCLYSCIDLYVCGKKASSRLRKKIFISDFGWFFSQRWTSSISGWTHWSILISVKEREPDTLCPLIKDPCVCTYTHTRTHIEPKSDEGFGSNYLSTEKKLGTGEHISNTMEAQSAKSKLWKTTRQVTWFPQKINCKENTGGGERNREPID